MKKKMAIVTLYGEKNFGNKLQSYATQVFFSQMGFECKIIRYCSRNNIFDKALKIRYEIFSRMGLRPKIPSVQKKREKKFRSFTKRNLVMGETVNYNKVPRDLKSKYDYFVTGSDQVWHNYSNTKAEINFFMLSFADQKQRLTMSPSFGVKFEEISRDKLTLYRNGLNGFDRLSCREKEASELIKKISGQKAEVTLDPTMLIDMKYWRELAKKPDNAVANSYLVTYFLGGMSEELKTFLRKLKKDRKMEVIDLYDLNNPYYYTTGPEEFLWWIEHADAVATDSYHATVFSILFKKFFFVYSRINGEGMEDRIDTLLEKFELRNRKNIFTEEYDEKTINYEKVDEILSFEIDKAKEFYNYIL